MPDRFDELLALGDNRVNFDALVRQLCTGGVVPFVGAGMSVPYGLPGWRDFLVSMATDAASQDEVVRLLDAGEYEEGAEVVLARRGGNAFQDRLQHTFGAAALSRLSAPPASAAVELVPFLCEGVVLTTNFDTVLERVFLEAGRTFGEVLTPSNIDQLARAAHEKRRALVHLHGVADERSDRVLTRSEYEARYGARTPLAPVLRAFMMHPLLFLGCSLQNDRPVRALLHLADELRGNGAEALLRHFAVLEYPADAATRATRVAQLERMGVRPIWFPTGDFGGIRLILERLMAQRSGAGGDGRVVSYADALLATFRLEGTGLALDGASARALALSHAYAGTRYRVGQDKLSLERLVDTRGRLVLLGEPGSGKSVTLKRALAFLARRSGLVPAYLSLADFALDNAATRQIDPSRFFTAIAGKAAALGASMPDARTFEQLYRSDRLVIALDGFDEIGSRTLRERVAAAVGRLSELTPNGRLLLASRPGEYRTTPLPEPTIGEIPPFALAEALPLEGDQIRAFLRESFGDDGSVWSAIRSDPRLVALARTPLFLTILALVAKRGPLPKPPIAVFDAIVDTALESWEEHKGGAPADSLRTDLESLALFMQRRESPASSLAESEAVSVLGGNARATTDFLVDRTGLLTRTTQRGAKTVRSTLQFAHLQLQEYLAACALARVLCTNEADGLAMLATWGEAESWREPQLFLAARLAQEEAYGPLQACIGARLEQAPPDADGEERSLYLSAAMLAEADAEFCPAPALESDILDAMSRHVGIGSRLGEKLHAMLSLVPRRAALHLAMALVRNEAEAIDWLGDSIEGEEGDAEDSHDAPLIRSAHCIAAVWQHVDHEELRPAVDLLLDHVSRSRIDPAFVGVTPCVEQLFGRGRALRFLRDLSIDNTRLADAWSSISSLLNAMEEIGYGSVARDLALEMLRLSSIGRHTADCAEWLLAAGDDDALAAYDQYLRRLERGLSDGSLGQEAGRMWSQPLWPARDSDAAHALRLEVLEHRDVAWYVLRDAIRDPRYVAESRAAWIDNVRHSFDSSRRNGLIHDMLNEPDARLAVPLLLESFRGGRSVRWHLEGVVRRLIALGHVHDAKDRLVEAWQDASLPTSEREHLVRLMEICDDVHE